jgi:hypothetical protein
MSYWVELRSCSLVDGYCACTLLDVATWAWVQWVDGTMASERLFATCQQVVASGGKAAGVMNRLGSAAGR